MLTSAEFDRLIEQRVTARKTAEPPAPGHAAVAAADEYASSVEADAAAQNQRDRLWHELDPYLGATPSPGYELPAPFGTPARPLTPSGFTRGPLTDGRGAPSPSAEEVS